MLCSDVAPSYTDFLYIFKKSFQSTENYEKICTHIFPSLCMHLCWPCSCGEMHQSSYVQAVEASWLVADVAERLSVLFESKTSIPL